MAVGVDYALFYIVRSREERQRGLPLPRGARAHGAHLGANRGRLGHDGDRSRWRRSSSSTRRPSTASPRRRSPSSPAPSPARSRCSRPCSSCSGRGSTRAVSPTCPTSRPSAATRASGTASSTASCAGPRSRCALSAGLLIALAVPALWLRLASPDDTALAPQSHPGAAHLRRRPARFRRRLRAGGRGRNGAARALRRAVRRNGAAPDARVHPRHRAAARTAHGERGRDRGCALPPAHRDRRQRVEPARDLGPPRRADPADGRPDSRARRSPSPATSPRTSTSPASSTEGCPTSSPSSSCSRSSSCCSRFARSSSR